MTTASVLLQRFYYVSSLKNFGVKVRLALLSYR